MRAAAAAILVCLATLGVGGCSGGKSRAPKAGPVADGPVQVATPEWLPPYTPAQQALLRPITTPVQIPASRIFPDLSRFGYADDRRIEDLHESMKFTRMVAKVLQDSPRFYELEHASADLANLVAQYGPPGSDEADGWYVVRRDSTGVGSLVQADLSAAARADYERGTALGLKGDLKGAIEAFTAAITKSPGVPGLRVSLGETMAAAGDSAGARQALQSALEVDPTFSTAHRALAELSIKAGDLAAARRQIAEALAYHPSSKKALAVADQVTFGAASAGKNRVHPIEVFIDVDVVGAIHVAAPADNPSQMYAGCRAVMRWEPGVRAAIFKQPAYTPYYLSVTEEAVCLEAAIGAYLFGRVAQQDENDPGDPVMEELLELAQTEGLSGYAMFEILGQHRPERARAAPPGVHQSMVRYVGKHVLGSQEDAPAGSYTASR
jgi:tetratricopeptide (TPR) repeat protein